MSHWYRTQKRAYLLDFQIPDSFDQMPIGQARNRRNIDVEDIVRRLHEAGVEAVYPHAKDNQGNCYYEAQYGWKHTDSYWRTRCAGPPEKALRWR
jgi:hypothetical protein